MNPVSFIFTNNGKAKTLDPRLKMSRMTGKRKVRSVGLRLRLTRPANAQEGLQFRNAGGLHNPFNLNPTAHKRMDLAMIRIGSRRQFPHAEPLAGMKMFGGKGAIRATPTSVVCHGMRLHRPVIPLNRLPRKDCHGRGRIKRHPIQKDDLRILRLAQAPRQDKYQPAKTTQIRQSFRHAVLFPKYDTITIPSVHRVSSYKVTDFA